MISDDARRAAKLSRFPGVTIAEAAKRFGVTAAVVSRARKEIARLTLEEIAVACVTDYGKKQRGTLTPNTLSSVAGWIDYVDHDGCTPDDVRKLLTSSGYVALDGDAWTLVIPWP